MRASPILLALFPKVRTQILAAVLTRPEREWFLSELAAFLHVQPSSLQREIGALAKAGILELRRDGGRRIYFSADMQSPVFADLKGLFEKTAGVIPVLKQELEPYLGRLKAAFVYGSVARAEEQSDSDIDLVLVGNVGLADVVPALRRAERRLGRPVNSTVFTASEFKKKIRTRDHFVATVLRGAKHFVKGTELDLASA